MNLNFFSLVLFMFLLFGLSKESLRQTEGLCKIERRQKCTGIYDSKLTYSKKCVQKKCPSSFAVECFGSNYCSKNRGNCNLVSDYLNLIKYVFRLENKDIKECPQDYLFKV